MEQSTVESSKFRMITCPRLMIVMANQNMYHISLLNCPTRHERTHTHTHTCTCFLHGQLSVQLKEGYDSAAAECAAEKVNSEHIKH